MKNSRRCRICLVTNWKKSPSILKIIPLTKLLRCELERLNKETGCHLYLVPACHVFESTFKNQASTALEEVSSQIQDQASTALEEVSSQIQDQASTALEEITSPIQDQVSTTLESKPSSRISCGKSTIGGIQKILQTSSRSKLWKVNKRNKIRADSPTTKAKDHLPHEAPCGPISTFKIKP
ncbi:hypothetical protein FF1_007092 [Malus domestica]